MVVAGHNVTTGLARPPRRWRMTSKADKTWMVAALSPTAVGLLLLYQFALVALFVLSLTDFRGLSNTSWIGFDNYRHLFALPEFYQATGNTLKLVLKVVPFTMAVSLGLALLLNGVRRGQGWYRMALILPLAATPTAAGVIWRFLYRPDGAFNRVLEHVGIDPVKWLTSPDVALWAVALMTSWQYAGLFAVIIGISLRRVPPSILEAAELDGAGSIRRFWHITLPLIGPTLTFCTLVCTTHVVLALGSIVSLTPSGGPRGSTRTLAFEIHRHTFESAQAALGATVALLMIVLLVAITGVQLSVARWLGQGGEADE